MIGQISMINSTKIWAKFLRNSKPEDNKYTRGHLLINGAPIDCTGATKLAAFAAARSGAGMVTVACDEKSLLVYSLAFQSIMAKPFDDIEFQNFIKNHKVRAVLLGPGNGVKAELKKRVAETLKKKELKTIIDADAISIFENDKELLLKNLHNNCILTPHEGEFKRIFSLTNSRVISAQNAANLSGSIIVLKGHHTIIASPDGRIVENKNAPVSLATAGSGDVLAGIIASLAAQNMPLFEAACAAVWIHGKAAQKITTGLIADDLPDLIPQIMKQFINA